MTLPKSEAYCAAALFTQALYAGFDINNVNELKLKFIDDEHLGLLEQQPSQQGIWRIGGLCHQVYSHLNIPSRQWSSLMMLQERDYESIKAIITTLENSTHIPDSSKVAEDSSAQNDEIPAKLDTLEFAENLRSSLECSLTNECPQYLDTKQKSSTGSSPPPVAPAVEETTQLARTSDTSPPESALEGEDQPSTGYSASERSGVTRRVSGAVVFELIAGCLGGNAGDVDRVSHWFDSRGRVAVRLVAEWLGVKHHNLVSMEALLAFQMSHAEINRASLALRKKQIANHSPSTTSTTSTSSASASASISNYSLSAFIPSFPKNWPLSSVPKSGSSDQVNNTAILSDENQTGSGISNRRQNQSEVRSGDEPPQQKYQQDSWQTRLSINRILKVSAGVVGGGLVFGLTGGIAAPAIATGVASAAAGMAGMGVGTAASATTVATIAAANTTAIGGVIGAAGAGLTGFKVKHLTGGVREFEFKPVREKETDWLALTICVSGWVRNKDDMDSPWRSLGDKEAAGGRGGAGAAVKTSLFGSELFSLHWETEELTQLSGALSRYVRTTAVKEVIKHGAMQTALQGLLTAVAWPSTLVSMSDAIDNIWSVCVERADKAALLLAQALKDGWHGDRPVTLVGYSLGARLIFKCLLELEKMKCVGIVEDVVLISAPITERRADWSRARSVVAGRLINAHSSRDWLLGLMRRASAPNSGVAGVRAVKLSGIENCDMSPHISNHWDLPTIVPGLLDLLGIQ